METDTIERADTLTLSPGALFDLVTGALVCAGGNKETVKYSSVYLVSDGETLSARATDKFRLIIGTISAPGAVFAVQLTRRDSERIASLCKPFSKVKGSEVSLSLLDGGALRVAIPGELTIEVSNLGDTFPDTSALLGLPGVEVSAIKLDAGRLATFSKVPSDKSPVTLNFSGVTKPVTLGINHPVIAWQALLMPCK